MRVRNVPHFNSGLMLVSLVIVLAAWSQAAMQPAGAFAVLLDNVHWTVAYSAAAWMTWNAAAEPGLSVGLRRARIAFAAGLGALSLGQAIWDIQVYSNWLPFPGPSDAFFLLLGPAFLAGFVGVLRQNLPSGRWRVLWLDVGGFALGALALTLTLYLPLAGANNLLQMTVLCAYPVVLLSAAATALMMQLHLRHRWGLRWLALFGGVLLHGVCWMLWNLGFLVDQLPPGAWLNLCFSMATLLLGWGASGWKPQPDVSASFDRLCEGLLRQLPLAMVSLTSAAIGLLALGGGLADSTRAPLLGLGLAVLLFAVVRQTQQLGERDRLLVAERVVAESQAQLQHLAHHDPLTGLPNLTLLRDRVQQALAVAERRGLKVALMFIDLDHFKEVNDSLGHATGDALLCHVATELQQLLRGSDTVCRQGGDEFSIVLPEITDLNDVGQVAEKVMGLSRSTALANGHELPLSLSLGVALYPDDAHDFNSLLQCADTAMYRAKAAGRSTYRFYDARMNAEAAERIQLRSRLARALERRELSLHWQPQIEFASGAVCGAEALLRWTSAELGEVSPAAFIPVAEDGGLINEIGAWVLREACRQAAAWQRDGLALPSIALNLSVLQFRRGNLEHQVVEALRLSGLPASALELEITESVLMQDHDKVFGTVDRLQSLGVRLAIDDFGTGYSSLSYVKRLRVATLKIDKSFVRDALDDEGTAGIVRAVIEMARVLGVQTVAEGVESEAQRDFLAASHCGIGQGFWFARPMAAPAFEAWLRERSPLSP